MEPDSTTCDPGLTELNLPFAVHPGNLKLYLELASGNGERGFESQLVQSLQELGLIPKTMTCPTTAFQNSPNCNMKCKKARIKDRVQWICECCSSHIPVRSGSVFMGLQCSMLQVMQVILAWCEDADCAVVAEHFGVKPRVASAIYDKLDSLTARAQAAARLGGDGGVVVAEMFPDCTSRLSPDTTEAAHAHRVLMLADTMHIPTRYCLHVIKEDVKKATADQIYQALSNQVSEVISKKVIPNSTVVVGNYVPSVEGALSLQSFLQYCDPEMRHFLCERVWSQAAVLCSASRDLCASSAGGGGGGGGCANCHEPVQRYLDAALYRLRHHPEGFYRHALGLLADQLAATSGG